MHDVIFRIGCPMAASSAGILFAAWALPAGRHAAREWLPAHQHGVDAMTGTPLPAAVESRDPASGQGGGEVAPSGGAMADVHVPEDALIIVPVRNLVLFPGLIVPVEQSGQSNRLRRRNMPCGTERPVGILLQTMQKWRHQDCRTWPVSARRRRSCVT